MPTVLASQRPLSVPGRRHWDRIADGFVQRADARIPGDPLRRRLCPLALRKGLALLVYLAEAKGPVGRDVIATMLWPESPRRSYGHGCGGCCIASSSRSATSSHPTDPRFDGRRRSICRSIHACSSRPATAASSSTPADLYQGDFLDGFSPGDCPQFDEWAFFRREALRGRAIQALERVVQEKNAAATTRPPPRMPAVWWRSIRSAKCTAATSSAISCSAAIGPRPSATSRR